MLSLRPAAPRVFCYTSFCCSGLVLEEEVDRRNMRRKKEHREMLSFAMVCCVSINNVLRKVLSSIFCQQFVWNNVLSEDQVNVVKVVNYLDITLDLNDGSLPTKNPTTHPLLLNNFQYQ